MANNPFRQEITTAIEPSAPGTLDVMEVQQGPEARRAAEVQGAAYLAAQPVPSEFAYQLPPGEPRPQPAPTGDGPEILPLVIADLTTRAEHGRKKYGTTLRANNGRSSLRDAKEEVYDLAMYLRQFEEDLPRMMAEVRMAALEEALALVEEARLTETGQTAEGALWRLSKALRELQQAPPKGVG